jgi:hypothetical protein
MFLGFFFGGGGVLWWLVCVFWNTRKHAGNIHIAADNSTQQQTEHNKEEYKKNA